MLYIVLVIAGAVVGAAAWDGAGALFGAALGYAVAGAITANRRMTLVEGRLQRIEQFLRARTARAASPAQPGRATAPAPEPVKTGEVVVPAEAQAQPSTMQEAPLRAQAAPAKSVGKAEGSAFDETVGHVRDFFTGGNLAVKVGVVVLFFGVSFLLKYAVEHSLLSVEARLIGAALGGIALIVAGWRLRERRRNYALVIQGGGIGILYLTTFAALRLYFLIPSSLAFFILVSLAVFSAMLAVLQDATPMAVLGVSGGFLAPVLTSTGGGNYIFLFSYYAVLNASIMAVAWFRAWRLLNVTGFVFTFVIGTVWGFRYYQPSYFATTEPFLILFFLMYVSLAVMYALRRQVDIKAYLDGTLVFGTPIVCFALQSMLVSRYEYGIAISAFALGAFYTALAWALFRKAYARLRLMTEAFLSFGVVFATLAIPLAVDGRWTASAWALEGAAVLWAGTRQGRKLARAFGALLQIGAGVAFSTDIYFIHSWTPFVNAHYLGCLLISLAGVFSALTLYKNRERVAGYEFYVAVPLLIWGLMWWFSGGLNEVERFVGHAYLSAGFLAFISFSCLVAGMLERRLDWPWLKYPALVILPGMFLVLIYSAAVVSHPFTGAGYISWPLSFAACYVIMYNHESINRRALEVLHGAPVWLFCALTAWETGWRLTHWVKGASTWALVSAGAIPAIIGISLPLFRKRLDWPFGRHALGYIIYGLGPVIAFAWAWSIYANMTSRGNPWPLSYMPFLNPLDVAVGFVLVALADWYRRSGRLVGALKEGVYRRIFVSIYSATVFLWLNAVLVRTVHYWGGVSFARDAMMASVVFQASLSIFWSVLALGTMVLATLRKLRPVWIAGAGLLGAVVFKLFTVDLSKTGTVARIVSFVVVGVLLLLVGYFSPVPPKIKEESRS